MATASLLELLAAYGPYLVVFIVGILTHRAGLVDLTLALLHPTGTTSKALSDLQAAINDVRTVAADVKAHTVTLADLTKSLADVKNVVNDLRAAPATAAK